MSVSDRLRELDEGATPGPWWTRGVVVEAFSPGRLSPLHVADIRRDEIDATLIATLRNALPELVAVVRAAGITSEQCWTPPAPDSESYYQASVALRDALAALDAELSGQDAREEKA